MEIGIWRETTISPIGWYESLRICFLPGALALEILHSERKSEARPVLWIATVLSLGIPCIAEVDLQLAHRLVQTCVHMYWRTASDLAPEITRFNQHGLADDVGSMHNILRPETS